MNIPKLIDLMIFEQLSQFRQRLYEQLGNAKDAVFELMDAVLVSASIGSFVSLSQSPVFRRQWSSVYVALHDRRLPQAKRMRQMASRVEATEQPILAGDCTFWSRQDAVTLKERTFAIAGKRVRSGKVIVRWHGLQTAVVVSFETPGKRAAFELQQVRRPLAVYDQATVTLNTTAIEFNPSI